MFSIDIDGKPTDCEINFGTALDYELEFGKDMVADMNGSRKQGDPEFLTYADDGETLLGIDFTAVPWTTLIKVLWCAVKTANPRVKPFNKWASETKGVDILSARLRLSEAMGECFFRNAPVEQDGDE